MHFIIAYVFNQVFSADFRLMRFMTYNLNIMIQKIPHFIIMMKPIWPNKLKSMGKPRTCIIKTFFFKNPKISPAVFQALIFQAFTKLIPSKLRPKF